MGAIAGIWSREKCDRSSLSIQKMADRLKVCDNDQISIYVDEHLSLGYVSQINRPLRENVCQDDEYYLLYIGDILNLRDIVKNGDSNFSMNKGSGAEGLLHFYKERKGRFAQDLNGTFSVVIYHKKTHELMLINDRLGQIRIYYTQVQDKTIFSSKVKAILSHDKAPLKMNEISFMDRFLFRSIRANESLFEGVHLLPPASLWRIRKNGIKKSKYWDLDEKLVQPCGGGEKADCLEKTRVLFNQAVRRTLTGDLHFQLGLTAGLDSRCILSAIPPDNTRVSCFTIGNSDNPDVIIAKELASIYGFKHEQKKIEQTSAETFIRNLKKAIYLSEGLSNLELGIYIGSTLEQREQSDQVKHITGTLGTQCMRIPLFFANKQYLLAWMEDTFLGKIPVPSNILTPLLDQMFERIIRLYIGIPEPSRFFTDRFYKRVKERFHSVNRTDYQAADRVGFTTLGGKLYYLALKNLIQNLFPARNPLGELYYRTPFIEKEFFEYIVKVPLSLKSELKMELHRYIIEHNNIDLTSVPYYNKAGIATFNKGSLDQWKDRISTDIPKTILFELGNRIRTDLREFTTNLLLNDMAWSDDLLNRQYVRTLVQDHLDGKINVPYTMSNLIIFELWHQLFFAGTGELKAL
jgi:asparagine synthetase B (glutamine-hydrolysing)